MRTERFSDAAASKTVSLLQSAGGVSRTARAGKVFRGYAQKWLCNQADWIIFSTQGGYHGKIDAGSLDIRRVLETHQ